jgi:secreted PhoX family phosphatase
VDYATGQIKASVRINKDVLPQPEGIAFDQEGNLSISTEAKKGDAAIVIFNLLKL